MRPGCELCSDVWVSHDAGHTWAELERPQWGESTGRYRAALLHYALRTLQWPGPGGLASHLWAPIKTEDGVTLYYSLPFQAGFDSVYWECRTLVRSSESSARDVGSIQGGASQTCTLPMVSRMVRCPNGHDALQAMPKAATCFQLLRRALHLVLYYIHYTSHLIYVCYYNHVLVSCYPFDIHLNTVCYFYILLLHL